MKSTLLFSVIALDFAKGALKTGTAAGAVIEGSITSIVTGQKTGKNMNNKIKFSVCLVMLFSLLSCTTYRADYVIESGQKLITPAKVRDPGFYYDWEGNRLNFEDVWKITSQTPGNERLVEQGQKLTAVSETLSWITWTTGLAGLGLVLASSERPELNEPAVGLLTAFLGISLLEIFAMIPRNRKAEQAVHNYNTHVLSQ